jgi:pyruvate formate lyase activating enzyme
VSNAQTLKNFAALAARFGERPEVPLLTASTLLVPGYVDLEEIHGLARFLARLNPEIPYSLLGFYPQFYLTDLPITTRDFALQAQRTAQQAGVKNVHLGNLHLLW